MSYLTEEYDIIESSNREDLVFRINALIKEGWQPGSHIQITDNPLRFYQSIFKPQ